MGGEPCVIRSVALLVRSCVEVVELAGLAALDPRGDLGAGDVHNARAEVVAVYQWFFCALASSKKIAAEIDTFRESADPSIGIKARS
jgi:hypothetical protein